MSASKKINMKTWNQINTTVYMLPENHTDKIQPIDAGRGRLMKGKIGATMETWLEEENNLDKWQDRHLAKDLNNPMDWGSVEWVK